MANEQALGPHHAVPLCGVWSLKCLAGTENYHLPCGSLNIFHSFLSLKKEIYLRYMFIHISYFWICGHKYFKGQNWKITITGCKEKCKIMIYMFFLWNGMKSMSWFCRSMYKVSQFNLFHLQFIEWSWFSAVNLTRVLWVFSWSITHNDLVAITIFWFVLTLLERCNVAVIVIVINYCQCHRTCIHLKENDCGKNKNNNRRTEHNTGKSIWCILVICVVIIWYCEDWCFLDLGTPCKLTQILVNSHSL